MANAKTKEKGKKDAPEVQAAPTMDDRFRVEYGDGFVAFCQLSPREKSWAAWEANRGVDPGDHPNPADMAVAAMRVGLRSIEGKDGLLYDEDQIADMKRRTASVRALPIDCAILDDEAVFPGKSLAIAGLQLMQLVNVADSETKVKNS